MKSPSLPHKISTLIYAFNRKGELLMLHRRRSPNRGLWSPFGGKLHTKDGESPHQCAARETREEIGLKATARDFHLTGMVSEQGYEDTTHWLMFMFELKVRLNKLPPPHKEGDFAFIPVTQVARLPIPDTDRRILWPLFRRHRGGFFSVSIRCLRNGSLKWQMEET